MTSIGENGLGHAVSKILYRPELCDEAFTNVITWMAVVQGMMAAFFPHEPVA